MGWQEAAGASQQLITGAILHLGKRFLSLIGHVDLCSDLGLFESL